MRRIELTDIGLTFRVRRYQRVNLKDAIVNLMLRHKNNPIMEVNALSGINLEISDGDRLGIIGHNGAGKSTLLKLLAGIYPPTHGTRRVQGRVSSLFDLSLGFEPEANGWDNILFRGYLQGETPASMRGKVAQIAEFSELGAFLDMPVRYYSAGMLVRLAFSIATAIEPEILLVDEMLSAGDMAFQLKATQRMSDLMNRAQAIVIVSHDMGSLARICDRIAWIDHGQLRRVGPAAEVIADYEASASAAVRQAA